MDEEALKYAYELFQKDGYNDSIEDFTTLINNDDEAFKHAHLLFAKDGYNDGEDDFRNLIGVKKKEESNSIIPPVNLESDAESTSSAISEKAEIPKFFNEEKEEEYSLDTDLDKIDNESWVQKATMSIAEGYASATNFLSMGLLSNQQLSGFSALLQGETQSTTQFINNYEKKRTKHDSINDEVINSVSDYILENPEESENYKVGIEGKIKNLQDNLKTKTYSVEKTTEVVSEISDLKDRLTKFKNIDAEVGKQNFDDLKSWREHYYPEVAKDEVEKAKYFEENTEDQELYKEKYLSKEYGFQQEKAVATAMRLGKNEIKFLDENGIEQTATVKQAHDYASQLYLKYIERGERLQSVDTSKFTKQKQVDQYNKEFKELNEDRELLENIQNQPEFREYEKNVKTYENFREKQQSLYNPNTKLGESLQKKTEKQGAIDADYEDENGVTSFLNNATRSIMHYVNETALALPNYLASGGEYGGVEHWLDEKRENEEFFIGETWLTKPSQLTRAYYDKNAKLGDYTYIFDKDNNITSIRDAKTNTVALGDEFQYAKNQWKNTKDKPKPEKNFNYDNLGGKLTGSVTDMVTLIYGGGVFTKGLKSIPYLSKAKKANDAIGLTMSGWVMEYQGLYDEAVQTGKVSRNDASNFAALTATYVAALENISPQKGLLGGVKRKLLKKNTINLIKDGVPYKKAILTALGKQVKTIPEEITQELMQEIGNRQGKATYNRLHNEDIFDTSITSEEMIDIATATAFTTFVANTRSSASSLTNSSQLQREAINTVMNSESLSKYKGILDNLVQKGKITKEESEQTYTKMQDIQKVKEQIDESKLNENDKAEVIALMANKIELERKKQKLDPAFHTKIDENINGINQRIDKIVNNKAIDNQEKAVKELVKEQGDKKDFKITEEEVNERVKEIEGREDVPSPTFEWDVDSKKGDKVETDKVDAKEPVKKTKEKPKTEVKKTETTETKEVKKNERAKKGLKKSERVQKGIKENEKSDSPLIKVGDKVAFIENVKDGEDSYGKQNEGKVIADKEDIVTVAFKDYKGKNVEKRYLKSRVEKTKGFNEENTEEKEDTQVLPEQDKEVPEEKDKKPLPVEKKSVNLPNETKTKKTDSKAKVRSSRQNSKTSRGKKGTKQKVVKISRRGKVPLDQRKHRNKEILKASDLETHDIEDVILQWFITGGRIEPKSSIKEVIPGHGRPRTNAKGEKILTQGQRNEVLARIGYMRKDGKSFNQAVHWFWEEYGEQFKVDDQEIRDIMISIISQNLSLKQMAGTLNSKYAGLPNEKGEIFNESGERVYETEMGFLTEEQLEEYGKSLEERQDNKHIEDALDHIDVLTDEEIIKLAEDKELSYTQFIDSLDKNRYNEYLESLGHKPENLDLGDNVTHAMGISLQKDKRDLTGEGIVEENQRLNRIFDRVWKIAFRSNQGMDVKNGEIVRQHQRDIAVFSDALNFEVNQLKRLIKKIKGKDKNKNIAKVNEYLAGNNVDLSFLPKEQIDRLDLGRKKIDKLSNKLIAEFRKQLEEQEDKHRKRPSETLKNQIDSLSKLIEKIESNKGTYLNRSYQIFTDEKYRKAMTMPKGKLNRLGQKKIDNVINFLVREQEFSKKEAEEYIAKYLDDIAKNESELSFISSGSVDDSMLKEKKDLPLEFRQLLGESKDPIYNYTNTVFKLSSYLASIEYQKRLRDSLLDSKIAIEDPKQGYTQLAGKSSHWEILDGLYVPNEFKQSLDDMMPLKSLSGDDVMAWVFKKWISFTAFTKVGKTLLSPTTTARNLALGGFMLNVNAGHLFFTDMQATSRAWNIGWGTKKAHSKLREENKKLIRLGVAKDGGNAGEILAVMNDMSKSVDRMTSPSTKDKILEGAQKLYAFGDDFYKVAGFYIEKKRLIEAGVNEGDAEQISAERIRGGYPTYSYVPKGFQYLRRIPFIGTFVSFPYEVVRTTKNNALYIAEDIKEKRWKMAGYRAMGMLVANGALYGISVLTRNLIGWDDDDDDTFRNLLPEYQRDSKLIYLGTKNGSPEFIDGTALFPSETIMKPLSVLFEEREGRDTFDKFARSLDEFTNPYLSGDLFTKTMGELVFNKNEYGQEIYRGESLPEGIKKDPDRIFHYFNKKAGVGAYNNLTEFARANNIYPDYFGEKFTSYGREYNNKDAFMALMGIRKGTVNFNSAISGRGREIKEEFVNEKIKTLSKLKSTRELSEADVDKVIEDYSKFNKELHQQSLGLIQTGRKLGMTDKEITDSFANAKYSKTDLKLLLKGEIPKLKEIRTSDLNRYVKNIEAKYKNTPEKQKELVKNLKTKIKLFNKKISALSGGSSSGSTRGNTRSNTRGSGTRKSSR